MIPYVLYVLVILLGLTQILDWYSTTMILDAGGEEKNPVAKFGIKHLGQDAFLGLKAFAVIAVGWWLGTRSIYLLGLLVAVYIGIIIYTFLGLRD